MENHFIFRGKSLSTNAWVYGGIAIKDNRYFIVRDTTRATCPWDICEVDPETVGRCANLDDKNGDPAFEGDIIFWRDYHGNPFTTIITWDDEWNRFATFISGAQSYGVNRHLYSFEIVGNIHDDKLAGKGACPHDL